MSLASKRTVGSAPAVWCSSKLAAVSTRPRPLWERPLSLQPRDAELASPLSRKAVPPPAPVVRQSLLEMLGLVLGGVCLPLSRVRRRTE